MAWPATKMQDTAMKPEETPWGGLTSGVGVECTLISWASGWRVWGGRATPVNWVHSDDQYQGSSKSLIQSVFTYIVRREGAADVLVPNSVPDYEHPFLSLGNGKVRPLKESSGASSSSRRIELEQLSGGYSAKV
jgi:hypothetical protein